MWQIAQVEETGTAIQVERQEKKASSNLHPLKQEKKKISVDGYPRLRKTNPNKAQKSFKKFKAITFTHLLSDHDL